MDTEKKEMISQNSTIRVGAIDLPVVGFGSYLSTEKKGTEVILDALEAGYRYIDTARYYHNEKEIGEALKIAESCGIPRRDLILCSKVWPTMLGAKETARSLEESLTDLGTDYLDLFLIHWPRANQTDEAWTSPLLESWQFLEELVAEGKIRAIGVSNFLPHHLKPLLKQAKIRPAIDQLELHVGYMQEYTLNYLSAEGIPAQAWSPLGRARMLTDERILAIAARHQKSSAQILLRYLLQRGIPVIPKASSIERMRENLDLFDFSLTEEEIDYLSCIPEAGWSGEHPDLFGK